MKTTQLIGRFTFGAMLLIAIAVFAVGLFQDDTGSGDAAGPVVPPAPTDVYDPVQAGEELPAGYRPLLDRDRIAPVYNPVFTAAADVNWPGDSLVIGISGATEAKAYPVTHLNSREMVIDSLEGIPLLVTW